MSLLKPFFFKYKQHTNYDPKGSDKINYTRSIFVKVFYNRLLDEMSNNVYTFVWKRITFSYLISKDLTTSYMLYLLCLSNEVVFALEINRQVHVSRSPRYQLRKCSTPEILCVFNNGYNYRISSVFVADGIVKITTS